MQLRKWAPPWLEEGQQQMPVTFLKDSEVLSKSAEVQGKCTKCPADDGCYQGILASRAFSLAKGESLSAVGWHLWGKWVHFYSGKDAPNSVYWLGWKWHSPDRLQKEKEVWVVVLPSEDSPCEKILTLTEAVQTWFAWCQPQSPRYAVPLCLETAKAKGMWSLTRVFSTTVHNLDLYLAIIYGL